MRVRALAFAALTILPLAGCGSFQHHGNFCGPGHPPRSSTADLLAIEPIDDIDRACKAHDLCYADRGANAWTCDEALIKAMDGLELNPACFNIANEIATYFLGLHPSREGFAGTISRTVGKGIGMPRTAVAVGLHALSLIDDSRAPKRVRCCDRRVVPHDPASPCYPTNASPARLRVMRALVSWSDSEGLYYEADIPPGVRRLAEQNARMPPDEPVLALLINDYSDFGTTFSTLVFTEGGMYYGRREAYGFLTWDELSRMRVVALDEKVLALGDEAELRVAAWSAYDVGRLIQVVRGAVGQTSP